MATDAQSLFHVFLRLRPPPAGLPARQLAGSSFISIEPPPADALSNLSAPTCITLTPPKDRRRAVEKFTFTRVFDQDASQLDVFHCTHIISLVEDLLAPQGGVGTDALLATLGVTGSGKSHTILGSRTQRGLTQLTLDLLFRSIGPSAVQAASDATLEASIKASDATEASISTAPAFIEATYGNASAQPQTPSTPQTQPPSPVGPRHFSSVVGISGIRQPAWSGHARALHDEPSPRMSTSRGVRLVRKEDYTISSPSTPEPSSRKLSAVRSSRQQLEDEAGDHHVSSPFSSRHFMTVTASAKHREQDTKTSFSKGNHTTPPVPRRHLARPAAIPQIPDISTIDVPCDPAAEYAVLISMYEVYNDRIFDLLTPAAKQTATKEFRRRPLPFRPTELSPERKVVSGLCKVICAHFDEAMMVLEAGLHERHVTGTLSNSVSSRSHAFFCIEVLKRKKSCSDRHQHCWRGSTFTIVDLAGSERARDAKTAGSTLAEAGKINESLMYLGQCLQMQSATGGASKPGVVPFRQCKLTELLFSNSFPSIRPQSGHHRPQRAVMIVTADPNGDFNATTQILRYSALARDVTVPQIPPSPETSPRIGSPAVKASEPHPNVSGSPSSSLRAARRHPRSLLPAFGRRAQRNRSTSSTASDGNSAPENAAVKLARVSEETKYLRKCLAREQQARVAAEAHLLSIEEKMLELEQTVREDCVAEFEQRLAIELSRWKAGLQMAIERGEEHWDRKMEVFERGLVTQPPESETSKATENDLCDDKENVLAESLEEENTRLRREMSVLKRELASRGPAKRAPLTERNDFLISTNSSPFLVQSRQGNLPDDELQGEILQRIIENLTLHTISDDRTPRKGSGHAKRSQGNSKVRIEGTGSPVKKVRKPKLSKWEEQMDLVHDFF
ncbi:P-loop containing nucleoside triphosphate hydrolase protein [Coniella lustricola]|uniref:Kinesin-like protein n=1 Tax=Coniella lustricola TaxID=2025994 RepID=A0A2T3AD36_9PEZI|nr:P-loop containing nucleoside triphosphate hydrolase protein [Coniella lustricola]